MEESNNWDLVIKPKNKWFDINFGDLWRYRDLVMLFVRRDFVAQYKQTILGPLWHVIQPLFTTFLFVIVFGNIAQLSTDGSPKALFYMSGIVVWNFFSGCLLSTANTFVANAGIFGKIYFPRLVIPISTVISTAIRFGIQFLLFFSFLTFYVFVKNAHVSITADILFVPLLLLIMGIMGLGFGIIISSLTTKYRDLSLFIGFGVQLLMYLTPVIYPAAMWKKYQWVMDLNPMTPIIESFRYAMMGTGHFDMKGIGYSFCFALVAFFAGAVLFNRTEKTFMDTV
jgi:lipopolysaccharide transport system permease protein